MEPAEALISSLKATVDERQRGIMLAAILFPEVDRAISRLDRTTEAGVRICLDHFGRCAPEVRRRVLNLLSAQLASVVPAGIEGVHVSWLARALDDADPRLAATVVSALPRNHRLSLRSYLRSPRMPQARAQRAIAWFFSLLEFLRGVDLRPRTDGPYADWSGNRVIEMIDRLGGIVISALCDKDDDESNQWLGVWPEPYLRWLADVSERFFAQEREGVDRRSFRAITWRSWRRALESVTASANASQYRDRHERAIMIWRRAALAAFSLVLETQEAKELALLLPYPSGVFLRAQVMEVSRSSRDEGSRLYARKVLSRAVRVADEMARHDARHDDSGPASELS